MAFLLDAGADIDVLQQGDGEGGEEAGEADDRLAPLIIACAEGDLPMVQLLSSRVRCSGSLPSARCGGG